MKIEITPNPAMVDDTVRVRVTDAPPRERVRLRAWTMDDAGRRWESEAIFRADASGEVHLASAAPLRGSYRGADAMGLFWSMQLDPGIAGQDDQYLKKELAPCEITIEADTESVRQIARGRLERHYVAAETVVRAVEEDGLAGILFIPPQPNDRCPAVITLGGEGGGLDWETAAALASHGFAALALPYFGFDPLPLSLREIPLEYFERSMVWLCAQPEIDPGRIALHGVSRGAELALLLAANNALVRAVVGVVPGSVIWQGRNARRNGTAVPSPATSSWSYRGEPMPYVPYDVAAFQLWSAVRVLTFRKPVRFAQLHRHSLRQREAVARATIPVEKIRAPILLISASDDAVWPSQAMAEAIGERLASRKFPYEFTHLRNPGAGHVIRLPHTPATTVQSKLPGFTWRVAFGGTAAANAAARERAWCATLDFLARSL